jgi:flagellar biosynthesis/type III secretory pathway protein FliH
MIQTGHEESFHKGLAEGEQIGHTRGIAEGKAEGEHAGKVEVAKSALAMGILTNAQISVMTGLSIEEIEKLNVD